MNGPHALGVDLDMERFAGKDADAARACALHSVERTMNLDDPLLGQSRPLKLPVDIGSEDESTPRFVGWPSGQGSRTPAWGVVCR